MLEKWEGSIFRCIQWAVVGVFAGRAYQHILWDAPYRALLWDELWMKRIIEKVFSIEWETFITSMSINDNIDLFIKGTGWFYLLCALLAIFIRRVPKRTYSLLLLGAINLIFLAFLYYKEKFFNVGQFFEYTLQFSAPIILWYIMRQGKLTRSLMLWIKVAIALTFICHGLYAIGYYPQPGYFVQMILNILGVQEEMAINLLKAMGYLDFVVSFLIFLPSPIAKPALMYAILWGFATAMARIWSNFNLEFFGESLHQHAFESLYRFPHFLIPLAVWFWYRGLNGKRLKVN